MTHAELVFKKKEDIDRLARFKAHNVTLVFMMLPGVNFTESFSLVTTEEAFQTQLAINLKKHMQGWRVHGCNIEDNF